MAYQAMIFTVGIYFMEDVLSFVKKYSCDFHKACIRHLNSKRKSTIIRKIGCYVKWIHAPRLHIVWREAFEDMSTSDDNDSINSQCLCSNNSTGESKNSLLLENRIEELEKELLKLREQVSHILVKKDVPSEIGEDVVSSTSVLQPPPPPPLPPPPPPPLPPGPIVKSKTLLVQVKPKNGQGIERDSRCTIIEELSKRPPKLRHVERSPGGRPIRSAPLSSDPADILAAVLKRRFEAIHGQKRE